MDLWTQERMYWREGRETLCGVDEAGAGPLAGPVYAAAVILPREIELPGLRDSKELSERQREALYTAITAQAAAWAVASASVEEIDRLDILNARLLAMQRALDALPVKPDLALVDGNRDRGSRVSITTPHVTLVGGDGRSASIAAASVLAKVSRDRYVVSQLDPRYPQYQFARHKGYGTRVHYEMLDRYGPCPAHRKTFLKKWEQKKRTREAGNRGEAAVALYLEKRGYEILARQWKCRGGELDLIAREPGGILCFVEVKLRGPRSKGLPREFVDAKKQAKLRKAASLWLADQDSDAPARFDVAEVYEEQGALRIVYLEDAFQ